MTHLHLNIEVLGLWPLSQVPHILGRKIGDQSPANPKQGHGGGKLPATIPPPVLTLNSTQCAATHIKLQPPTHIRTALDCT